MKYLKIHNWEKWQSYRSDRGQPPWIKVHRCIMRHLDWVEMGDAQRGQLLCIWLLAADNDGYIPADEKMIQKLCHMDTDFSLQFFIEAGFVDVAKTTLKRRQDSDNTTAQKQRQRQSTDTEYTSVFEEAWKHLHRRGNKRKAFKAWNSRIRDGYDAKMLLQCAKNYCNDMDNQKTEDKYRKHGTTFYSRDCEFEDWEKAVKKKEDWEDKQERLKRERLIRQSREYGVNI